MVSQRVAAVAGKTTAGRSRKAQEVTTRLLDAGVEVFGETGYETTRIHEVARRCGLTTGAIYARWPTKPQLFLAVVEHATSQRMASMAGPAETPVDESIGALGANLLSSGDRRLGDLMFETFVSARHDDSIAEIVSECLDSEVDTLTAMVTEGKEDGRIDPSLSTEAIVAFCQALDLGTHLALSTGAPRRPAPTAQEWQALMKRVIEAMAAPRSDEPPEDA
ncbi:MAG: TetR/AcrR family transcriptional regulator [Acidimicrobiaceae bacterium]|nr:TetR/AcrR family transcriptional regulator [Acidimicrobiaceae bacterium]